MKGFKVIVISAFPHYPDGKIPIKYKKKFLIREKWNDVDVIRTYVIPLPHEGLFKRFLIYSSFSLSALLALFYLKKIGIIWAFGQKFFSFFTGIIYKFVTKAPLLLEMGDIWPESLVNAGFLNENKKILLKIIRILFRILYRISDKIITLNEAMKKLLIKSSNIKPSKISILPNIAYIDKFKPIKLKENKYKNKFVVMYSGRFASIYDFENLLNAASILENYKDIQFIIKGTGDKMVKNSIYKHIRKNQLINVHIEERFLKTKEFIKFLNLADIFILPMIKCPFPDAIFPSKLMDYLSLGKPVVYSGDGYAARLIKKMRLGLVIKPGDPRNLSEAILHLKDNEMIRREMGKRAREATIHLFSPKIQEDKINDIFL
jgi:glycosyltransferase involved in cell wall biosynthesis